ncbi:hypothetical protein [Streptomyces sp. x-19]|uniref:hypothetical protein n=1 Tax=Streptomyces sp. x-19 TaxID=2789280 RepID=UPI003980F47A
MAAEAAQDGNVKQEPSEESKAAETATPNAPEGEEVKPLTGDSLELARLRAGMANGLSEEAVSILAGATVDELSANAAKLAVLISQGAAKPAPQGLAARPEPTVKTGKGSVPEGEPQLDPRRLAAAIRKQFPK